MIDFTDEELGILERRAELRVEGLWKDKLKEESDREFYSHDFEDDGTWVYDSLITIWDSIKRKLHKERERRRKNEKIRTCD